MAVTLTTKNKIGFVDGTIPCVAPIDFLFNAWNHCNNMVTSWILNSILKDIVDSLMYIATTTKIQTELHDCFQQSNAPQVF